MRTHPITGLRLEDGHGRLPDDLQARRIHIPYIRATQGDKVAERMLLELDHKERNTSDAWNEWRREETAKLVKETGVTNLAPRAPRLKAAK